VAVSSKQSRMESASSSSTHVASSSSQVESSSKSATISASQMESSTSATKRASITEKMASTAQSAALAIASQAQTSSSMQVSAHHQGGTVASTTQGQQQRVRSCHWKTTRAGPLGRSSLARKRLLSRLDTRWQRRWRGKSLCRNPRPHLSLLRQRA
jgi:hypothetical protein